MNDKLFGPSGVRLEGLHSMFFFKILAMTLTTEMSSVCHLAIINHQMNCARNSSPIDSGTILGLAPDERVSFINLHSLFQYTVAKSLVGQLLATDARVLSRIQNLGWGRSHR